MLVHFGPNFRGPFTKLSLEAPPPMSDDTVPVEPSLDDLAQLSRMVLSADPTAPLVKLVKDIGQFVVEYRRIEADLSVKLHEITVAYAALGEARKTAAGQYERDAALARDLVAVAKMTGSPPLIARASEVMVELLRSRPPLMKDAAHFTLARLSKED